MKKLAKKIIISPAVIMYIMIIMFAVMTFDYVQQQFFENKLKKIVAWANK